MNDGEVGTELWDVGNHEDDEIANSPTGLISVWRWVGGWKSEIDDFESKFGELGIGKRKEIWGNKKQS